VALAIFVHHAPKPVASPALRWLAVALLIAPAQFSHYAVVMYADLPFATYLLANAICWSWAARAGAPSRLHALVGLTAALSAWTKNEGLVVLVLEAGLLGLACWRRRCARAVQYWTLGALPLLLVIAYFKLRWMPANDWVQGQSSSLEKLTDSNRYAIIARAWATSWWVLPSGLLAGLCCAAGVRVERRQPEYGALLVMGLLLLAYCAVYLLTPLDLGLHLRTSLPRLLLQVWPVWIWACFRLLGHRLSALATAAPLATRTNRPERESNSNFLSVFPVPDTPLACPRRTRTRT
jgi:hypothetical protein